jgi:hypothetical protein
MSMNFGREQALLRQRFTASGSAELATERAAQFGDSVKFLGASDEDIITAATELADTYPQMGRAQMTAFVRTLWGSKTYELRAVGIRILSLRATLLEPPDMAFIEGLLKDATIGDMLSRIACDILGILVSKNKKTWKDLGKFSKSSNERVKLAAVLAAKEAVVADGSLFDRFEKLVTPLLPVEDQQLQAAITAATSAALAQDSDAAKAFMDSHQLATESPEAPATKKKAPKK